MCRPSVPFPQRTRISFDVATDVLEGRLAADNVIIEATLPHPSIDSRPSTMSYTAELLGGRHRLEPMHHIRERDRFAFARAAVEQDDSVEMIGHHDERIEHH